MKVFILVIFWMLTHPMFSQIEISGKHNYLMIDVIDYQKMSPIYDYEVIILNSNDTLSFYPNLDNEIPLIIQFDSLIPQTHIYGIWNKDTILSYGTTNYLTRSLKFKVLICPKKIEKKLNKLSTRYFHRLSICMHREFSNKERFLMPFDTIIWVFGDDFYTEQRPVKCRKRSFKGSGRFFRPKIFNKDN